LLFAAMSLENSNSKGKAVVKEEVCPLTPVKQKPFAVMSNQDDKAMLKKEVEEVSLPILETAAPHHHQTPSNDVSGSDDNNDVLGGTSGVQHVGSSSASAAHMMQQAAIQWGAVAAPTVILPAFQQLDSSRILLIKEVMQHCVTALATGDVLAANTGLVIMSTLASADGDPLQRVAFAFAEALGRRALQQMLPGLYGGLLQLDFPPQPAATGYTGATRLCFDALCPLLRVAGSVANHAIVTAVERGARARRRPWRRQPKPVARAAPPLRRASGGQALLPAPNRRQRGGRITLLHRLAAPPRGRAPAHHLHLQPSAVSHRPAVPS
jgi:hypothetical protein